MATPTAAPEPPRFQFNVSLHQYNPDTGDTEYTSRSANSPEKAQELLLWAQSEIHAYEAEQR